MIGLERGRLVAHSSTKSYFRRLTNYIPCCASREVRDNVGRHLHHFSRYSSNSLQHSIIQRQNIKETKAFQYARINEKLNYHHILGMRNFSLLSELSTKNHPLYQSYRFFGGSIATPTAAAAAIGSEAPIGHFETFVRLLHDNFATEFFQNSLLALHSYTGLPWWADIVLVTIAARTLVTLPLALSQEYNHAKIVKINYEMNDIVKQLKAETNLAVDTLGWSETYARRMYNRALKKQWDKLVVRDNCHPMKGMILFVIQFPMWLTLSASLRNLCFMLPLPTLAAQETFMQLKVGGFGWISDLTAVDGYCVTPIFLGLINLAIIEAKLLGSAREPTKMQKIVTNIFRGISIMMVPMAGLVPSCMGLYWVTSSAYGLVQNFIIVSPRVRRLVGIPETEFEQKHPYQHLYNNLKKKYTWMQNTNKA